MPRREEYRESDRRNLPYFHMGNLVTVQIADLRAIMPINAN